MLTQCEFGSMQGIDVTHSCKAVVVLLLVVVDCFAMVVVVVSAGIVDVMTSVVVVVVDKVGLVGKMVTSTTVELLLFSSVGATVVVVVAVVVASVTLTVIVDPSTGTTDGVTLTTSTETFSSDIIAVTDRSGSVSVNCVVGASLESAETSSGDIDVDIGPSLVISSVVTISAQPAGCVFNCERY